jgi:DNA-binding GntR family transcriptional regulator
MSRSAELRGGLERSAAEHRALLAAIDAGDALRSARLLEEHIEVPQRLLASPAARALFEEENGDQPPYEESADG